MASVQKEYEMLFKLGAKVGESFKGSFNSAKSILAATQKEIVDLNKKQSDVAAYEKQQTGIDRTKEKLDLYKTQLANVRKEMAENGKYSSDLANKEEALKVKIKNTELALTDKNLKLNQMSAELSEAGIDVKNLTSESDRLEKELKELKEQEAAAGEEVEKFGDKGASAFEAVGSALVAAGIASALRNIAGAYKECVDISMEFGSTMSTVEALSGANVSEMNQLSATAKELGANTAFTANQSAQAMTYMGMAGWDAKQMIAGMDGVMDLSAASGEDLALVADIVTDNLTAFGLKASDTAHFADVLAAAASNSNTSVAIMGETFKGSASVAGALGYSIEDVAVATGLMANAGVKGSIANTALKNTFNGLLEGVTLTSAAFGEAEISAVNADGTMEEFSDTIDKLRVYFDQMTEAERVSNAQAIAGQRGYNGLLAILNATDEDYIKLTEDINSCTGAAKMMADIKLDNLKGDVTLLDSAADGLKMTVGELWNDELRGLAQVGTEVLSGVNQFVEQNPGLVKGIMLVGTGIGTVVAGYTAFTTVKKVANALDALGITLTAKKTVGLAGMTLAQQANTIKTAAATKAHAAWNRAVSAAPMIGLTAAITAATIAISVWREACKKEALETQTLNNATTEQINKVDSLTSAYDKACSMYGKTDDRTRALKYDLDEATAAVEAQSFSVKELYAEIDTLHNSTADLINSCNEEVTSIDNQYESAQVLTAKLKELTSASDKSAASQAKIEPIINRLNEMYPELGLTLDNVTDKMGNLNNAIEQTVKSNSMQAKYEAAKENLDDLIIQEKSLIDANEKAEKALSTASKNYSDTINNQGIFINGKNDPLFSVFLATLNGTAEAAEKDLKEASEHADSAREDLYAVQQQIAECEAIMTEYGGVVSGESENTVSAYDAISIAVNNVTEETENLLKAYNDAYQAAYESVNGQYALWDQAAEISAVSVDTINSSLESQASYWENYNANLESLLGRSEKVEGLRDILATFADGSKDSVNAIAGLAGASDEDLNKMVENWKKVQEEQAATSESLASTKVDFEEQMKDITEQVAEAIDNMNMEDDAAKAAMDTIKAYADTIAEGKGMAVDAANQVSYAVTSALASVPVSPTAEIPVKSVNSTAGMQPKSGRGVLQRENINAYAVGTDFAEKGPAVVGENGPELVYFGGGEKVYTAQETRAILGDVNSRGTVITIAPTISVSGGYDDNAWQEASDRLVELIEETLREQGIDARRSAYA